MNKDTSPLPSTPQESLEHIRRKIETLANDYNAGKLNRDQFDAIYAHYKEQMAILERMIETNPSTSAWKRVVVPGVTSYLQQYHAPQPLLVTTLKLGAKEPVFLHGKVSADTAREMAPALAAITQRKATIGLVRRQLKAGWMVIYVGEHAATLVVYSAEPTKELAEKVQEAHRLFERANALALSQPDSQAHRYVFPQRSLTR
jgi:hypothetical protein